MESVLDFARSLIRYDRAAVLIWREERKALQLQAGRGLDDLLSSPERQALEEARNFTASGGGSGK